MRVPTLQTSRQNFDAISQRQQEQARLQSQLASGLRVQSPGDDPVAAAQAEIARSRLTRITQDQRANQLAASTLNTAEGALSQGTDLLQSVREALVAAGNGAYSDSDRQALAQRLRAARDELLQLANQGDGAGGHVFGGQGSNGAPFGTAPIGYAAAAGEQRIGSGGGFAASVDGRAAFLAVPQGNGVFATASAGANTGTGWIDAGEVTDATQLTGHGYAITVGGTPAAPTYGITDMTTGAPLAGGVPFQAGGSITVAGQRVTISGTPAAGDTFTIAPAGRQSVFRTLDDAVALLENTSATPAKYAEGLERAQTGIDRVLDGFSVLRTKVGEELRQLDHASADNAQQELNVTGRRSDLEDLDLARGISALQNSQTGLEAALKSYATISRRSLFELLG